MKKYNPNIYAFDPTPKAIKYVENHQISKNQNFHFYPFGISDKNEIAKFHLPKNPNYVSGSMEYHKDVNEDFIEVEMKSLETICNNLNITKIDILKLDIEGSEFNVIPNIFNYGIKFDQLCIETHERFFKNGITKKYNLFKLIFNNGYKIISAKDDYTFIREELFV